MPTITRHPNEKSALLYNQRAEPLRLQRRNQVAATGHPDLSIHLGKSFRVRGQILRSASNGTEIWHDLGGIEVMIDGLWQPVSWTAGLVSYHVRAGVFIECDATITHNPGAPTGGKPCPVCFVADNARCDYPEGYTYQAELTQRAAELGIRI